MQLLIQITTGHGLYKAHMSHMRDFDAICDLCEEGEKQTTYHLWAECYTLEKTRKKYSHMETLPYEKQIIKFFNDILLKDISNKYV